MAPSICEPALAFKRKDGSNKWWTPEEELILVNRLLRDDPTKGDLNNRTAVSFKEIVKTIITPDLLPIYIVCQPCAHTSQTTTDTYQVGLFAWIPFQPTANYLSLTLRNLGYTVFEANVLTIPSYALFTINVRRPTPPQTKPRKNAPTNTALHLAPPLRLALRKIQRTLPHRRLQQHLDAPLLHRPHLNQPRRQSLGSATPSSQESTVSHTPIRSWWDS